MAFLALELRHWMPTEANKHFFVCKKHFLIFFFLSLTQDFHGEKTIKTADPR